MSAARGYGVTVRIVVAVLVALIVIPVALAGLAATVDLPGEEALKERLGFEPGYAYGACAQVPGAGDAGAWRAEAPLPVLQDEARAVVVGDSVYIAGGVGRPTPQQTGTTLARFERFDVTTGRYERLPDLPIALDHIGMAAHAGSIYVLGGHGLGPGGAQSTNRAFRYVIAERKWDELPPMSEARGGQGVAVVGDRIYVVGGRATRNFDGSEPSVGLVEAFDTKAGRWSRVTTMPDARDHLGVAELGGQIYVYAGRIPDGTTRTRLDRYDPATNTWTRLADGPVGTSGIVLLARDGELYTAGGEVPLHGQALGSAWVYRVAEDRWKETTPLPGTRHGYASVFHGDRLYLIGGSLCPGLDPTRRVYSRPLPL
jgi:N-acetylneuraminic acid mutarotase